MMQSYTKCVKIKKYYTNIFGKKKCIKLTKKGRMLTVETVYMLFNMFHVVCSESIREFHDANRTSPSTYESSSHVSRVQFCGYPRYKRYFSLCGHGFMNSDL